MKKVLLAVLLCSFSLLSKAQAGRVIDLAAYVINSPDTVRDAQPVSVIFSLMNMGPDTMLANDTLLYQVWVDLVTVGVMGQILTAPVIPFDTITVTVNMGTMQVQTVHEGAICIESFIQSRGVNAVANEVSTYANNSLCDSSVHFTKIFLSVNEPGINMGYSMYPNPAINNLSFDFNLPKPADVAVIISEVSGREMISGKLPNQPAGNSVMNVDVSSLAAGIYVSRIHSGTTMKTAKLVISR